MIVIHQAIYGEVLGKTLGHGLLAASDETQELFKRVSGYTDLADRPEAGVLSAPVIRGFIAEDHFLLIKTFPDKSPEVRTARVFSHVLFIPKADLYVIQKLSDLFQFHLPSVQKEAKLHPLEYHSQKVQMTTETINAKEVAATNALLQRKSFVWLGKEGYWEWMDRIWPQLPHEVRCTLKIGAAFNPSYTKNEYFNLLYIPPNAKTLWARHSFSVIDHEEAKALQSASAHWLIGNPEEAASFQVLLDDFAPKLKTIEQLNQLQSYGEAYHQIDSNPGLNHLLVLAHFISQTSPNERMGSKGKNRLMAAILDAIPSAEVDKFIALIYQNWKGFQGAITSVSNAMQDWLTNHMLQGKYAKRGGLVLTKALEAETKNWWSTTVIAYVTNRLTKRKSTDALVLWQWIKNEPVLIAQHKAWLPDDAEDELVQKIPKLETPVAEAVLHMAEQKDWLLLHAKVAVECYPPKKAVAAQLRIDTDEDHDAALRVLSKSIKEDIFVPIAASYTDVRLHRIAGELIAKDSDLLKDIDVTNEGWQHCWEVAILHGSDVWSGIANPQQTLFDILDHLLAGNSFSETLVNAVSVSKHSSLKDYPERASIWSQLPAEARSRFISATLGELVNEIGIGKLHFHDLEIELKNGLQSQEAQQFIIRSKTIPLKIKIRLFDVLHIFGEDHAKQLIKSHTFSPEEAHSFGRVVYRNRWLKVIDVLYTIHFRRSDLIPALLCCVDLLGFWKRAWISASGVKRDAISKDEWWNEFLRISCKLFPSGPEQDGLWISAGGDSSQLSTNGSGREKWSIAIRIVRYNGHPTVGKLVKRMLEQYPGNEQLKNLQLTL